MPNKERDSKEYLKDTKLLRDNKLLFKKLSITPSSSWPPEIVCYIICAHFSDDPDIFA